MKKLEPKRILYASHWWLEDLMRAVAHQASRRGWYINFQMAVRREIPHHWRGDGILTTLSGNPVELDAFFKKAGCPVVSLNINKPEIDVPRVDSDMVQMGRLAGDHFLERGFQSLAFFRQDRDVSTTMSHQGFQEVISQAGHTVHLLDWQKERGKTEDAWPNRHRWLRRKFVDLPKPLGVLAVGPMDPAEIIEACMAESLDVPEDVAVLGRFDTPIFRESSPIPLSLITEDFEKHAEIACDLLSRLMAGEAEPTAPILLPPIGIAARKSTETIAARDPVVARVIRYMFAHFAAPLEIADLCRVAGVSRTHLFVTFKADQGASPHVVLTRIRLDKARIMLRETDWKTNTVATECGFGDQANFFRHFKGRFAMTPGDYRRMLHEHRVLT